jgi:hypothetical protein
VDRYVSRRPAVSLDVHHGARERRVSVRVTSELRSTRASPLRVVVAPHPTNLVCARVPCVSDSNWSACTTRS